MLSLNIEGFPLDNQKHSPGLENISDRSSVDFQTPIKFNYEDCQKTPRDLLMNDKIFYSGYKNGQLT